MKKFLFLLLVLSGAAYLLAVRYPGVYYTDTVVYDNFTLHSRGPLGDAAAAPLSRAREKIAASEFFAPGTRFEIYISSGPGDYSFFTPFCHDHYACVDPLNGNIMLAPPQLARDSSPGVPSGGEFRPFNSVVAAAATREMTRRALLPLTYLGMSEWKLRGYSELVSGTGAHVPSDICSGTAAEGTLLRDYEYRMAVEFAMRDERISYKYLLDKTYSFEYMDGQIRKIYCGGKSQ